MAHTSLKLSRVSAQGSSTAESHKQLDMEKVGVMLGFVAGLFLAVGGVNEFLVASGSPEWLNVGVGAVIVALTTVAGLRLASTVSARLGWK